MPPKQAENDLTNRKFGDLSPMQCEGRKTANAFWVCRCKCGTLLRATAKSLRDGSIKRCGPCTVAMGRDKAPFPLTLGPACDECGEKRMVMMHTTWGGVFCSKCYVVSLRAMESEAMG